MHHVSAIETRIRKRHVQRAPEMEGSEIIEGDALGQRDSGFDEFRRDVDAGDPASVAARDKAGGAAKTTPNFKNMFLWREPKLAEKLLGGLAPADVKLVHRSKIIDSRCSDALAKRGEGCSNRLHQVAMGVVKRDFRFRWHFLSSREGSELDMGVQISMHAIDFGARPPASPALNTLN